MNREIKFRIFDKKFNQMLFFEMGDGGIFSGISKELIIAQEKGGNYNLSTLMQFTGLYDKNKKPIYEGDIIKSPSWWWGPCFVFFATGQVGPCKGDNVMEWGLGKNIKNPNEGAIHNLWDGEDVEIIGNIYENQELLDKPKE